MKTDNQLAEMVKGYVKTLSDVVSGNDAFREFAEGAETAEYDFDFEHDRLRWYFEGCLDVDFIVDSRLQYKGAIITLACGGPGIRFNTRSGEVEGYWAFEKFSWDVDYDTCNAIDDFWAEQFDYLRGC